MCLTSIYMDPFLQDLFHLAIHEAFNCKQLNESELDSFDRFSIEIWHLRSCGDECAFSHTRISRSYAERQSRVSHWCPRILSMSLYDARSSPEMTPLPNIWGIKRVSCTVESCNNSLDSHAAENDCHSYYCFCPAPSE